MDKRSVARILEEIGTLLELKGENPFKTRAYQNGARLITSMEEDLETVVAENRLDEIRGIGPALAEKITELVRTGKLEYHERLRAEFPDGFLDLLSVPGLGPKKAKLVFDKLGVTSIDSLEEAAKADRIRGLEGFGQKSQEKILQGIEHIRKNSGRYLVNVAEREASRIVDALSTMKQVKRISVAGSLRRRLETVKDIDVVVATDDPAPIMQRFVELSGVESVIGHGETKSSVRMESGIAADLRCVSDAAFPYALMYFTGSKAHNVALRGRAVKRKLTLNEYGLYRDGDSSDPTKNIPCADEAAIYHELGMAYVEPEIREDTGEIAAAEKDGLPDLITEDDIKGLLHLHTNWSDGSATIEEMARAAIAMGLKYLGITDHSQSAIYANGLTPDRVKLQHKAIEKAAGAFKGKLTLFKGIESDILADGSLDYPEEILEMFDYVVASVHSGFNLTGAQQTARVIKAVANPHTRILGHPTGRLLLQRDGFPLDINAVLDACAAHDVAVEINAHPNRLDLDWRDCGAAIDKGCRITINPDAHSTEELLLTRHGVGIARKGWLRAKDVINTMTAAEIRKFLAKR